MMRSYSLFFAFGLLLSYPLFGQTPAQRGLDLYETGDNAGAKRVLLALSLKPPVDPDVWLGLGKVALAEDEEEKAVAYFEKAIAARPDSAEYHFWLGQAFGRRAMNANPLKQAGLARKVKAEFEKAVQLDPRHVEARYGLIDFYLMAPAIMGGSDEKAKAQVAEIRKIDPLEGRRAAARLHARDKQFALAEQELRAAVRAAPTNPKPLTWLGGFFSSLEKYDEAMQQYENALRLDRAYMPAYFGYGRAAARSGRNLERGAELLQKYVSYKPRRDEPGLGGAHFWLGTIYEKRGDKGLARQQFLAAQKLSPKSKDIAEALKRVS